MYFVLNNVMLVKMIVNRFLVFWLSLDTNEKGESLTNQYLPTFYNQTVPEFLMIDIMMSYLYYRFTYIYCYWAAVGGPIGIVVLVLVISLLIVIVYCIEKKKT